MEKFVAMLGCVLICLFLTMGFFFTTAWLWGCVPGFFLTGLGLLFIQE